jgi:hypothetical protein
MVLRHFLRGSSEKKLGKILRKEHLSVTRERVLAIKDKTAPLKSA